MIAETNAGSPMPIVIEFSFDSRCPSPLVVNVVLTPTSALDIVA